MRKREMGKRLTALALSSVMIASLLACSNDAKNDKKNEEPTTLKKVEAETEKKEPELVRPAENTVTDYDVKNSDYQLLVDASEEIHDISDMLMGIFIEDINFAADGGLYAEKVVNRSFEFTKLAKDDELFGWKSVGAANVEVKVKDTANALNENNANYAIITNETAESAGLANKGFLDGLSVKANENYKFSVYAKGIDGYTGDIDINIVAGEKVIGSAKISGVTSEWKKYEVDIKAMEDAYIGVTLQLTIGQGKVAVDMVSLFPENTFKNRENGLREDLATMIAELEPSFVRFPGGCVIEGYDYETMYNWKDSIGVGNDGKPLLFNGTYGDVAARKQGINLWTDIRATDDRNPSFMTYGLGFYEYFQLAEDIGAIGVPVVNCGLYCQMRQGAAVPIGSDEFKQFIQDALDLVEFCRGDVNSTWGKVRASLGHPEPFELKYIGIGNENQGDDYYERYAEFVKAFDEAAGKNPALFEGIELMYSSGVDDATSSRENFASYEYAKEWLAANPGKTIEDFTGATDHHYYNTPEWFFANANYYDEENYSRDSLTDTKNGGMINVFLGEYAAKSNTLKAALAEAAYMTGIERNGDIIKMAAYAPLFGNLTATHWSPDLIWFNNRLCTGSINYYMQKVFSTNVGTKVIKSVLEGAKTDNGELKGMVGVGTWNTTAKFDNVSVVSNKDKSELGKQDFSEDTFDKDWFNVADGKFKVTDGELYQSSAVTNAQTTGSVAYFGYTDWNDYTFTVDATKLSGEEGFLIPIAVEGKDDNYFWNIGGWGNTVSCLQQVTAGSKSDQLSGTVKDCHIDTNKTYKLKVVVSGTNIKCYINDELYVDFDVTAGAEAECYQVVSTDENGDIIVKLVNITGSDRVVAINIENANNLLEKATVYQVKGTSLTNDNILGAKEDCIMEEFSVEKITPQFNYTLPQYSTTVIRIPRKQ